jgi:methionyl-tRNA formyltransferase
MRIVFIGTVEFSRTALSRCLSRKADVVGVVTRRSSAFNTDFADLEPIAAKNNIPLLFTTDVNTQESLAWIRGRDPDVIFCFGWSSLLNTEVLSTPPLGVIGFHPAALPQNRGRHPLIWALALGLEHTASTFFFMDDSADSGDILSQAPIPIAYEDDARSLYNKVTDIALTQIDTFLPSLASGNAPKLEQDHKLSNTWRKRTKADGRIDFRMSSRAIYNLVRALAEPYPGAYLLNGGEELKVWKSSEIDCKLDNIEPGKVLVAHSDGVLVKCGVGAILLIKHEFAQLPKSGDYLQ